MKGKGARRRGGQIHLGAQTFMGRVPAEWSHKGPVCTWLHPSSTSSPAPPPAMKRGNQHCRASVKDEDNGFHYRQVC